MFHPIFMKFWNKLFSVHLAYNYSRMCYIVMNSLAPFHTPSDHIFCRIRRFKLYFIPKIPNFQSFTQVQQYCPELTSLCQMAGRCPGSTGPGSNYMSTIDAKIRYPETYSIISQNSHLHIFSNPLDAP